VKPLQIFIALVTLVVCVSAFAWLSVWIPRWQAAKAVATTPGQPPASEKEDYYKENPFKISEGPQPKAVIDEVQYQFGRMALGETGEHDFIVRNEGQAPLKLAKGPSQCKCTLAGLKEQEVPPGGEAAIHLAWTPKDAGAFSQVAVIWTNDPNNPRIAIGAEGKMFERMVMQPAEGWALGHVSSGEEVPLTGRLYSSVIEKFEITDVKVSSDRIQMKATPMVEALLTDLDAKSGYTLEGKLLASEKPGSIQETITITTNAPKHEKYELPVTGTRTGAMTVIGPGWYTGGPQLDLGRVSSEKGKEVRLTIMLKPGPEELKLTGVKTDPGFVQVRLKPEQTGKELKRERYTMIVTVPPGSPKGVWSGSRQGKVTLSLNHPQVNELTFQLHLDVQ
jgi:hypothetical protein